MNNLIIVSILLFISIQTYATAPVVKVIYTKGFVYKIDKKKKKFRLVKGSTLSETDWVRTSKNAFAILKIEGHSVHRIEEDTLLRLKQLPYFYKDTEELEKEANLYLLMGTIISDVTKKFDSEALVVQSKNTTMGVRGTKFLVSKERDKDLLLSVKTGQVEIENKASGSNDFITKDESIVVEKDKSFTQRKKYDFQDKIDWNVESLSPKQGFKKIFKDYRSEFKKKKAKWVKNSVRIKKLEGEWSQRKRALKEKIKKLKSSKGLNKELKKEKKKTKVMSEGLSKKINSVKDRIKNNERIRKKRMHLKNKKKAPPTRL